MSFSGPCWLLGKAVPQAPGRLRQLTFGFRQMKKISQSPGWALLLFV